MRNLMYLGVVVAIVGVAALLFGSFSYTETKPVLDAGPIHIATNEEHHISVPVIAGVIIVIAGLGLIAIGSRKSN